jgi:hypothetical protein
MLLFNQIFILREYAVKVYRYLYVYKFLGNFFKEKFKTKPNYILPVSKYAYFYAFFRLLYQLFKLIAK